MIYDVTGRLVDSFPLTNQPINSVTLKAENYPSGIYFVRLKTDEYIITKKLILLR